MSSNLEEAWEASRLNNLEALKKLVPSKVKPDAKKVSESNHCHSLLMCAAAHGSDDCANYLLEAGADVNLKNFTGFTALHWAAFTNRVETLDTLIKHGADLEERTADGKTAIHIAAYKGNREFIENILKRGADINAVDANGWNALHYTILSKQCATGEWLLKKGVTFNQVDAKKVSLFEFAQSNNAEWFNTIVASINPSYA